MASAQMTCSRRSSSSHRRRNVARDPKTKRPDRSLKTTKQTKSAVPARVTDGPTGAADLSGLKPKSETRVEIKPAKGRPMLTWVGKKPLRYAIAYPAQLVEMFHAVNPKSQT